VCVNALFCPILNVYSYRLGDMRVSECKFYDSKMRPLLLVYDNPDVLAVLKDVRIMFKHGDGKPNLMYM